MNNKEDFREYCKMLIALFESGDQESIDIYHKIQRYARDNSLYAQREMMIIFSFAEKKRIRNLQKN